MVRASLNQQDLRKEILNKGAEVCADKISLIERSLEKQEWSFMTLRIPKDLITRVDEIIKKDPPHSRTSWIINAVRKRLKDEDSSCL